MTHAKEALKAELLALYSQGLDEMLADCPEQTDFAVLEEQVERLAERTLPQTLSTLAVAGATTPDEKRGIFPPGLSSVPREASQER